MIQKTKRPAAADATNGPRDPDQLAREIGPTNNLKPAELQAIWLTRRFLLSAPLAAALASLIFPEART